MSLIHGYSSSEEEEDIKMTSNSQVTVLSTTSGNSFTKVGNAIVTKEIFDDTTFYHHNQLFKRGIVDTGPNKKKTKRQKGSLADRTYSGPWARFQDSSSAEENEQELTQGNEELDNDMANDILLSESEEESKQTTKFYGMEEFDYQGRTYMHIPHQVKSMTTPTECFPPKREIQSLPGHAKGITKLELFPSSSHLLLSCGNDSKIYLWSMISFTLLRGFFGHDKPIRDINFNNDGTRFLSASYDKMVILWDTETGEIIKSFHFKAVPNVVRFNPLNNDEFLVGLLNNKIEHHKISTGQIVQTYDHHLGGINDIAFLPEQKKFISTSEDKTIRVWDIDVNIPVKMISDPSLHSMPVLRVHPKDKYFLAQSMDNSVMVFSTKERYRTNKKKVFKGHNCAGYGIGIDISPDGKYIISGDSNGNLVVWEWKTAKLVKKLKIDDRAITKVVWNEKESSRVLTAGISGKIYYYD